MGSTQEERARRIVAAIMLELEAQKADHKLWLGYVDSMGMQRIEGNLDLYALADAIIKEVDDGPRTVLDTGDSRATADRVPAHIADPAIAARQDMAARLEQDPNWARMAKGDHIHYQQLDEPWQEPPTGPGRTEGGGYTDRT